MAKEHKVNFTIEAQDATRAAFESVKRNLSGVESAAMGLKSTFLALTPVIVGIGLVRLGKEAIDAADQLFKLSQKTGISVESLSTLRYAAQLSDVSLEGLGQGLKKLSVNMLDTQAGAGDAKESFKALGISVVGSTGKLRSSEDVMLDVAQRFAGMEDGAGKTALAVKLFGKSGSDLIPFLNQGRDGLAAMTVEAERLGLKLDTKTAKAAEDFNDAMTSLGFSIKGTVQTIMLQLIPGLTEIAERMRAAAQEGGILKALLEGAREAFGQLVFPGTKEKLAGVNQEIQKTIRAIEQLQRAGPGHSSGPLVAGQYRKLSNLYGQQRELEIIVEAEAEMAASRVARAAPKRAAPALPTGGKSGVQRGDKQMTFDELLAKNAATREKQVQETEDEATRAAKQLQEANERLARSYRELLDPVEVWRNKMKDLDEQMKNGLNISQAEYSSLMEGYSKKAQEATLNTDEFAKKTKEATDMGRELGLTFSSAFEDAVVGGKKFRDVLAGVAQDLARLAIRKTVTEPLAGAASSFFGNLFKGLFAGGGTQAPAPVFDLSPRAGGGPVSAGMPYWVGEQGPELFRPGSAGTVVPNNQLGGGVTVVQHINFSANTPAAVRDAVFSMMPMIQEAAIAGVKDSRARGRG